MSATEEPRQESLDVEVSKGIVNLYLGSLAGKGQVPKKGQVPFYPRKYLLVSEHAKLI